MDITAQQLKERLDKNEELVMVDVRETWENDEFNIGGANIALGEIMARIDEIEQHKENEVIVYCRSGNRSGMAQQLLQSIGFKNVRNLIGGMKYWQELF